MLERRPWLCLIVTALLGAQLSTAAAKDSDELKPGTVIELTELTFDKLIQEGIWLVDVYATWCSHCRQLEPVWKQVAKELKQQPEVHVAKVDGPKNRLVMSVLGVDAFPSLFLLRDKRMWAYSGPRSVEAIMEFAMSGYKAATPLPMHRCPNHIVGRALGHIYALPVQLRLAYTHLRQERGWSDLSILLAALAVPLVTGVATLCAMDALYVRKARYLEEEEAAEAEPPPVAQAVGEQ